MIEVTFTSYEAALNKTFTIIETHKSIDDASLRAKALNWKIAKVEAK